MIFSDFKNSIKWFVQPAYRWKVRREKNIKKHQNQLIEQSFPKQLSTLIVFYVNGADVNGIDRISGGILSIASIYEETERIFSDSGQKVIMVTKGGANLLLRYTQFENNIDVFRFEQITSYFDNIENLVFHVPEHLVEHFNKEINTEIKNLSYSNLHVNILNQRPDLMPDKRIIDELLTKVDHLTQTTAHEKYANLSERERFGIPLHKLSVFASTEKYNCIPFEEKEQLILYSPDNQEYKSKVIDEIRQKLPDFELVEINNIKYQDYLKLLSRAKYMITFGEGLDFYFIECIFSGGISFAVYNETFFTEDFEGLKGLFESGQVMTKMIVDQIIKLENPELFYAQHEVQKKQVAKHYKYDEYLQNLKDFYHGKYSFP